jgi:hypothetical protein
MVAGHRSKQETAALRSMAAKLDGVYFQGNSKHLPSKMLGRLSMIQPRVTDALGLRDLAFVSIAIGGSTLALVGPALSLFGRRSEHLRAVRHAHRSPRGPRPAAGALS